MARLAASARILLGLIALFASIAIASHASELDARMVAGPFGLPGVHRIDPNSYTGVADADKDIFPPKNGTEQILWGIVSDPTAGHPTGQMPDTNCFDRGYTTGVSNRCMDKAVALFCKTSDGTILDMKNATNRVSMMYTSWPPGAGFLGYAKHNNYYCPEAGQVYLHIGFGLGAPTTTAYTLSEAACVRGLKQVYNIACDNSHVDNKHGGQLDLGTSNGEANDHRFNDHLFYLADPSPPRDGRNMYCTNWNRFVPNLENTIVKDEVIDPCYDAHRGFGGKDLWWTDPPSWTDHDKGKADHELKKAECVADHGEYDGYGGTKDYYSR
ncbi:hypothetical protein B0A48_07261 [Cryoendolithus antarcticus]|uniref:Cyanovirin-N domain-containing protein n=1 Tax=Cryoendolithus antarcticus TaxID=1507870 RepID=A0A1V8T8F1_9PEZI|nr:hypothetical protein B0A48_07261 [Cryoendolithus antarcticus]